MTKKEKTSTYRDISENWKTVVLQGAISLVIGIVIIAIPGLTARVVSILLGALLIVYGVLSLVSGHSATQESRPGTWLYFRGAVAAAGGIVILVWPGLKDLGLVYILAVFAIAAGVFIGMFGLFQKWDRVYKSISAVSGLISVGFGVVLITRASDFAGSIIWIAGIYAIAFGLLMIILGMGARGIANKNG